MGAPAAVADHGRGRQVIRFDIDPAELQAIADGLGATERQIGMAISRALSRTAGTMRARASRALSSALDVRRANSLRKRLRQLRAGRGTRAQGAGGRQMRSVSLWVGLNDLAISDLKGRPAQAGGGATFRGREYPGGFVQTGRKGVRTIFKRRERGRFPIVEQTFPVADQATQVLEDDVFPDVVDVFVRNFTADLRARVLHGVGGRRGA